MDLVSGEATIIAGTGEAGNGDGPALGGVPGPPQSGMGHFYNTLYTTELRDTVRAIDREAIQ